MSMETEEAKKTNDGPSNGDDKTTALARHAKDVVSHVADDAKKLVTRQVGDRQKRSASELGNIAKALRGTKEDLGESMASPIVDRAAVEMERASEFLENATPGQILEGVEGFARREPLLFLGGAFAVPAVGSMLFEYYSDEA